jgi:hypothetical protein
MPHLPERFRRLAPFLDKHSAKLVAAAALSLACFSVVYYFYHGDVLAYGDAESHINIAKRVVSGMTNGFGQLGGVWLPLQHILMAPFVVNNYLWRTGLGGAIVSALAYVASVYFLFKLALIMTEKSWVALTATSVFALNPNALYMLATPMSELPLLAFLISSSYFFIRWILNQDIRLLVLAGMLSLGGVLIRYDAWFLVLMQFIAVFAVGYLKKWRYIKTEGTALIFVLPSVLGVGLWMLWCLLIFHNPLYFLDGPYSAKSQQKAFLVKGELPTYHNLATSLAYYSQAVVDNVGWTFAILAVLGIAALLVQKTRQRIMYSVVILGVLLSTFIFNVVSLFFGISILFIPQLTPKNFEYHLFNLRYGMMVLPTIALLIGMLLAKLPFKFLRRAAMIAVAGVALAFSFTYPITLRDGVDGLSARVPGAMPDSINTAFRENYDYGYVAFDDYARSANPVDLGIPMNKIIYDGSHPYWEEMLQHPNRYARFIIMQPHDALWPRFHNNPTFNHDYKLVASRNSELLYKCSVNCVGNVDLTKELEATK